MWFIRIFLQLVIFVCPAAHEIYYLPV